MCSKMRIKATLLELDTWANPKKVIQEKTTKCYLSKGGGNAPKLGRQLSLSLRQRRIFMAVSSGEFFSLFCFAFSHFSGRKNLCLCPYHLNVVLYVLLYSSMWWFRELGNRRSM